LVTALDADFAKNLTARARSAFLANRRMATLGGAAVAATLMALLFLWSRDPDYAVLYAGLDGAQGGRALAELQKLNIPYTISEGGRVILVPAALLGQARLQLAARGVPKTDSDAWGLLDNEALGVSPFIEQVHYVRGLEANLAHTVGELDGVLSAQVTLALPKRTGFLADEPKPSASVLLRLAPGARMSGAQVAGVGGADRVERAGLGARQCHDRRSGRQGPQRAGGRGAAGDSGAARHRRADQYPLRPADRRSADAGAGPGQFPRLRR
jgi:flagellar M-ring protein FliF